MSSFCRTASYVEVFRKNPSGSQRTFSLKSQKGKFGAQSVPLHGNKELEEGFTIETLVCKKWIKV
jgi:hypothetical protein